MANYSANNEIEFIGQWDPVNNEPNIKKKSLENSYFQASRDGTYEGDSYRQGDYTMFKKNKWTRVDNNALVKTRESGRIISKIILSRCQPMLLNSYNIRSICGKNLIGSGNLRLKFSDLDSDIAVNEF